ncbi:MULTISPECIES: potassium channel family protein [unclassified Ensifer]|uniref:potassium channel family protein n=1 Tax=unclassified Ensifer TaxID=2633371 RepID=UPI000B0394DA|nr:MULTISPECIES: potassium channel family protein [unclassified Ensifer]
MGSKHIRRIFFIALYRQLGVVWPILSGVLCIMVGCGLLIGRIEGWRMTDTLYFTFVTGLTIGYGDLVPSHASSRVLAVMIGLTGIVLTGLVAAVSVQALRATANGRSEREPLD